MPVGVPTAAPVFRRLCLDLDLLTLCPQMTAAVARGHGPAANVLHVSHTQPLPNLAAGDLLVQVHAAAINPVDYKFLKGTIACMEPLLGIPRTCVPGFDLCGTVVAVGPGAVSSGFSIGDQVMAMAQFTRRGALAQFVAVGADRVARQPVGTTPEQAAALVMVGQTSWQVRHVHPCWCGMGPCGV